MRFIRSMHRCALVWFLASWSAGGASSAATVQTLAERIERQGMADPERAVRLIEAAATPAERPLLGVAMLEVSGRVYADLHRDADLAATVRALQSAAARGDGSAVAALHYVRAYALTALGRYAAAAADLDAVDVESIQAPAELYRWSMLRAAILQAQGQPGTAATVLQSALRSALRLEDDVRSGYARVALAAAEAAAGNPGEADEQAHAAETLATSLGDEALLADLDGVLAELAGRRGDPTAERRLRVSAVAHAGAARSNLWLGEALMQLGGSYLRTGEFRQSLKYSQAAAPLLARTGTAAGQSTASLNEGLALIGSGSVKQGQEIAEQAIADTLANDDRVAARDMLRDYARALERAGYLMMAIGVHQRIGALGDRLLAEARAGAGASDLLMAGHVAGPQPRDTAAMTTGAAAASTIPAQRVARPSIIALVLATAGLCAAGVWGVVGVRRADARARSARDRDSLTGALNRRYFNEQILPGAEGRAMKGCVLLADLDHLKRINDTWGHAAGDAVLCAVAERLAAVLRDADTLVRWEGDAFLCVLDAVTSEQANRMAERLLDAVRHAPIPWRGHAIDCSLSIGHACFPLAGAAAETSLVGAISLVDKALVEAKRRGRDRACLIRAVGGRAPTATDAVPRSDATDSERTIELTEMGAAA